MTSTRLILLVSAFLLLASCTPQVQQTDLTVNITADGNNQSVTLTSGSTVQQALDSAQVTLSQTDRVEPPTFTKITAGMVILVTRVAEQFETQQVIIPYERQELHNESLPSGDTRLVQAGQNGLREVSKSWKEISKLPFAMFMRMVLKPGLQLYLRQSCRMRSPRSL